MIRLLRKLGVWIIYRLIRVYWWIRKPVILGVRVLIVDDDRALFVKHSYRKGWSFPGGKPESGETLVTTAYRETEEETGLSIEDLSLFGVYSSLSGPESNHVVVFDATLSTASSSDIHLSTEVEEACWVPLTKELTDLTKQTEQVISDFKNDKSGNYRTINQQNVKI